MGSGGAQSSGTKWRFTSKMSIHPNFLENKSGSSKREIGLVVQVGEAGNGNKFTKTKKGNFVTHRIA